MGTTLDALLADIRRIPCIYLGPRRKGTPYRLIDTELLAHRLQDFAGQGQEAYSRACEDADAVVRYLESDLFLTNIRGFYKAVDKGTPLTAAFRILPNIFNGRRDERVRAQVSLHKKNYVLGHTYQLALLDDEGREVETMTRRLGEGDDVISDLRILLPPRENSGWPSIGSRAWRELDDRIRGLYGTSMDSVQMCHSHKRDTLLVHTKDGRRLAVKVYDESQRDILQREYRILARLAEAGFAPQACQTERFLITAYEESPTLVRATPDMYIQGAGELAEMQSVLENAGLDIPLLDEDYFKHKFSRIPSIISSHPAIILPTLYPGHYFFGQEAGMKRIDVERVAYGPSEYFLLTFLLGGKLSQEEMAAAAATYLSTMRQQGRAVDERAFINNLAYYYETLFKDMQVSFESAMLANEET